MPNPNSIVLAATAEAKGLKSVLVGGNAVDPYGYHRTTFDVDLLVREKDSARWVSFFERHGYKIFQQTGNFIRLHLADDPAGALPVDLMLVDDATFRQIHSESCHREIGKGIRPAIREGSGSFDLRRFDSLPAAAGLTVTEAFRLSIEHALALLPSLSKDASFRIRPTNPERFSLR